MDADYKHAQRVWVWEDFRIQNRGQYYILYLQSDTLLPAQLLK